MVAVVIPCFKVKDHILQVIKNISKDVAKIYVVDDCCPEGTGAFVSSNCRDPRVEVINHVANQGVGGAVLSGYRKALQDGAKVVVKIDGDGQMNPAFLPFLVKPLLEGQADYAKGNRFFDVDTIREQMPTVRLLGNSALSFIAKLTTGYWSVMDPTNGYTAIHTNVLRHMPLDKISKRYFFENDMLFRLSCLRAVVKDISIPAKYGNEKSSLNIFKTLFEFPFKFFGRFIKRLMYRYFIYDFNLGTFYLLGAFFFLFSGAVYGGYHYINNYIQDRYAPIGVVMLAALPIILGFQLLLSFFNFDVLNEPKRPVGEALHFIDVTNDKNVNPINRKVG